MHGTNGKRKGSETESEMFMVSDRPRVEKVRKKEKKSHVFCSIVVCVELSQSLTEAVGQPPSDLVQDVPLVVVTESPGHLVVSHVGAVSVLAPESGKGGGIVETEESLLAVLPVDHVVVGRLLEHAQGELPQLGRSWDIWREGGRDIDQCLVLSIACMEQ